MLRILREGQRWIMAVVIVLVGGAFVFFLGSGGSLLGAGGDDSSVVRVGERRFGVDDFRRLRAVQEESYRESLGDNFDSRAAAGYLDQATANLLVQRAILAEEGRRLGLRVSDAEVRDTIRQIPGLSSDGRFDQAAFKDYIDYEWGTERRFVEAVRFDLLVQKAAQLLSAGAGISDGEARDAVRYGREEVRIAYVALDPQKPPGDVEISETQVTEFLAGHEERVRGVYEEQGERWNQGEAVRARHILLRVPADAEPAVEEEARQKLLALRQEIEAGADFGEVASRESADTASAARGGDLDFFERGSMVEPFEDAAFALEVGALSEPVRTNYGFHLIRVEEKRVAKKTDFEAAREEIARELIAEEIGSEHVAALREVFLESIRAGKSLEETSRSQGLTLERTPLLRRNPSGYIPDLGHAPDLLTAAFALDGGESAQEVFDVAEKQVLIQLIERHVPDAAEIGDHLEETRERLLAEKRQRVQVAWIEGRRASLSASGQLSVNLEILGRR